MWPFKNKVRLFVAECAESIAAEPNRWRRHMPFSFYHLTRDDGLDLSIYRSMAWFSSPVIPELTALEKQYLYRATAAWPGDVSLSELLGLAEGEAA